MNNVNDLFFEYVIKKENLACDSIFDFFERNKLSLIFKNQLSNYMNYENRKILERKYIANCIGEKIRRRTMCKIDDILSYQKIYPIFFKGSILATELYADPFSRIIGDIDMFVCDADYSKALELLKLCGYSMKYERDSTNPHHIGLTNEQTFVELHHEFITPYILENTKMLADNIMQVKIDEHMFCTLDYTNTIAHLLLHLYMDTTLCFGEKNDLSLVIPPRCDKYYYRMYEIVLFATKYQNIVDWERLSTVLRNFTYNNYMNLIIEEINSVLESNREIKR